MKDGEMGASDHEPNSGVTAPTHARRAAASPYPDAAAGSPGDSRHVGASHPRESQHDIDEPQPQDRPPVAGAKRAPLPQWWWDQTVRTRRIIAGVVVALFVAVVVGLVLVTLSSSGEPEEAETQPVEEQAQLFVASLPAQRVAAWDALAECETEGDWGTATGNGFYGGLQFTQATWLEFGGTGSPHETTREVQIMIAERVQAAQGWGAWPVCASQIGL